MTELRKSWIYRYGKSVRLYIASDGTQWTNRSSAMRVQRRLDREAALRATEWRESMSDLDRDFGFLA